MRSALFLASSGAYDDRIVRAYCWGRFGILRQRFLDEIGQYLPARGRVLDVGCGFGLFSLYYASVCPRLAIEGLDLNPRRIEMARAAAGRLGLANVSYEVGDACDFRGGTLFDAVYMLDIVHHVPEDAVRPLLEQLAKVLPPGGRLLIKDVDSASRVEAPGSRYALDKVMDPATPVRYWPAEELAGPRRVGRLPRHRHLMVDVLPYPHVLYICERLPVTAPLLRVEAIVAGYGKMAILHEVTLGSRTARS